MRPAALLGAALLLAAGVGCDDPNTFPIEAHVDEAADIDGTGSRTWDFAVDANESATHEDPLSSLFYAKASVVAYLESCVTCTSEVTITVRCGQQDDVASVRVTAGGEGAVEASVEPFGGCEKDETCSRECSVEVAAEGDVYVSVDLGTHATVWVEEPEYDDAIVTLEVQD